MTVVTGRRQDVFAAPADAVRATRIAGLLALAASGLGAVLAVGVSRWPAEQTVVLVALLGLVAAVGTFAVLARSGAPCRGRTEPARRDGLHLAGNGGGRSVARAWTGPTTRCCS